MTLTDNWLGWRINHVLAEDHPHYGDYDRVPVDVDWKVDPIVPLRRVYLEHKFLRIGKAYYLDNDIETEGYPELDEPILVLLKKYDYGGWRGLEPDKKDEVLCSFYGIEENEDATPELGSGARVVRGAINHELVSYRTIKNDLSKLGERDKIAVGRRNDASNYLKQRAKEIDDFIANYGEQFGIEPKNLEENTKQFYNHKSVFLRNYIDSGSTQIINSIENTLSQESPQANAWLKEEIPIDLLDNKPVLAIAGEIIISMFNTAIAPVTAAEIESAIAFRVY